MCLFRKTPGQIFKCPNVNKKMFLDFLNLCHIWDQILNHGELKHSSPPADELFLTSASPAAHLFPLCCLREMIAGDRCDAK